MVSERKWQAQCYKKGPHLFYNVWLALPSQKYVRKRHSYWSIATDFVLLLDNFLVWWFHITQVKLR